MTRLIGERRSTGRVPRRALFLILITSFEHDRLKSRSLGNRLLFIGAGNAWPFRVNKMRVFLCRRRAMKRSIPSSVRTLAGFCGQHQCARVSLPTESGKVFPRACSSTASSSENLEAFLKQRILSRELTANQQVTETGRSGPEGSSHATLIRSKSTKDIRVPPR